MMLGGKLIQVLQFHLQAAFLTTGRKRRNITPNVNKYRPKSKADLYPDLSLSLRYIYQSAIIDCHYTSMQYGEQVSISNHICLISDKSSDVQQQRDGCGSSAGIQRLVYRRRCLFHRGVISINSRRSMIDCMHCYRVQPLHQLVGRFKGVLVMATLTQKSTTF